MHKRVRGSSSAESEYFFLSFLTPWLVLKRQYFNTISVWCLALFMAVLPIATAHAQSPWPGTSESGRIDITQPGTSMGSNLSGAVWNPFTNKLWLVSNSGLFWRMSCDRSISSDCTAPNSWSVDNSGNAEWVTGGDTEAITQGADWSEETVFIAVEDSGVEEYDVSGPVGSVNRANAWSLVELFGPGSGSRGLEALTFVPDQWLLGFTRPNGTPYESSQFGTGGLFFGGLQANGDIYVFDLDRTSAGNYVFVGSYTTGQNEIAGLEFDRSDGSLYSYHNGSGSGGQDVVQSLSLVPSGGNLSFLLRWFGPRVENNEGIALVPSNPSNPSLDSGGNPIRTCEADGQRHFYLTTDDAGSSNSLGIYDFPCTPTFTSVATTTASVGVSYAYNAAAAPVSTPITFSLVRGPSGMNVATNGSVSWTPNSGQVGTHTVEILAQNSFNFVATQTFVITVDATPPVNDAPSFTPGADQSVLQDSGPQTVAGWATAITAGAVGAVTNFNVNNNTNPGLFDAVPAIAVNGTLGTLSYTPAPSATGSATVTVTLLDDGGTANGGADTSAEHLLTIAVTP